MKIFFCLLVIFSFYSCKEDYPKTVTVDGEIFTHDSKVKTDGNYEGQAYRGTSQDVLILVYADGANFTKEFFPRWIAYTKAQGYKVEVEDRFVLGVGPKANAYITYNSDFIIQISRKQRPSLPTKISDAYNLYDSMVLIKN